MGKKLRDIKEISHAKMETMKDRKSMKLTGAKDIKKRWKEYTEELYKKCLHDPCKPMSIGLVMPSNHLILCRPLLLPPIFPSIRVFSNESTFRMRWPKYWSVSFNISPSNEYSGLISFRMAWLDLPAIQGTFKSLLQHHSSKASIWHSAFFIVQLSHPYMTTGKP